MTAVIMTCYNPENGERHVYAKKAIASLIKNLHSPDKLRLILADDGSYDDSYLKPLANIAENAWKVASWISVVKRRGIGGSLNAALGLVKPDETWLYTTDDWVLERDLYLDQAYYLITVERYDYVRLLPLHPDLECKVRYNSEAGFWLHLHHYNNHGFAFATRPFLAHRFFYERVGPFVELQDAYVTERDYSDRVKIHPNLRLAAVADLHGYWNHIGVQEVGTIQLQ